MINKCFSVKCIVSIFFNLYTKNQLYNPHENLHYAVRFQPMKPFKANIEFIVLRQSGGRWKYKIILEATQPDEDDVIIISSPLNKTASVSFKLTNKTKGYAKFYAGFTPESDAEFSVIPKIGDLEPYGREGTTFVIQFIDQFNVKLLYSHRIWQDQKRKISNLNRRYVLVLLIMILFLY